MDNIYVQCKLITTETKKTTLLTLMSHCTDNPKLRNNDLIITGKRPRIMHDIFSPDSFGKGISADLNLPNIRHKFSITTPNDKYKINPIDYKLSYSPEYTVLEQWEILLTSLYNFSPNKGIWAIELVFSEAISFFKLLIRAINEKKSNNGNAVIVSRICDLLETIKNKGIEIRITEGLSNHYLSALMSYCKRKFDKTTEFMLDNSQWHNLPTYPEKYQFSSQYFIINHRLPYIPGSNYYDADYLKKGLGRVLPCKSLSITMAQSNDIPFYDLLLTEASELVQTKLLFEIYLDELCSPVILRLLSLFGKDIITKGSHDYIGLANSPVLMVGDVIIGRVMQPAGLSIITMELYDELYNYYNQIKTNQHSFYNLDLVPIFYDITNNKLNLKKEFIVGYSNHLLELNYNNNTIKVNLALGVDIPTRNQLKRIQSNLIAMNLYMIPLGARVVRYLTIYSYRDANGITDVMISNHYTSIVHY